MRAIADGLLSVLLCPSCAACGALLEHPIDGPVCGACWRAVLPLTPPLCDACGDPLATWRTAGVATLCVRCRRTRRSVDRARAIGAYEGPLRAIVHAFKYQARRSVARQLGCLMRERGSDVLSGADLLVPVPLHRSRLRERGFNQAEDLARRIGLPTAPALRRVRRTATQADLPAGRRHANVRGAFAPTTRADSLEGMVVVLIDDVSTTGATLESCARVLKEMGVREVRALTVARVVRQP